MRFVSGGNENILDLVMMKKNPVVIIKPIELYTLWEQGGGRGRREQWGNIGTTVIEHQQPPSSKESKF